jgi:hypothetical protein
MSTKSAASLDANPSPKTTSSKHLPVSPATWLPPLHPSSLAAISATKIKDNAPPRPIQQRAQIEGRRMRSPLPGGIVLTCRIAIEVMQALLLTSEKRAPRHHTALAKDCAAGQAANCSLGPFP